MKKYILIILLTLIIIPINVKAVPNICINSSVDGEGYCSTNKYGVGVKKDVANSSGYGITSWQYVVNDQIVFCMDAANQYPTYTDRARNLDMNSSRDRALATIYRVYLIEQENGDNTTMFNLANDAMRLFIHSSGSGLSGGYPGNPTGNFSSYVSNLLGNNQSGNREILKKMYCAGVYAAQIPASDYNACKNYIDNNTNLDMNLLTLNDFNFKLYEDTTVAQKDINSSKRFAKEITLKISGTENIKKILEAYPSLRNKTEIKINSCSVDGTSAKAGFTCRIVESSGNLLNGDGKQKIIIENNNLITKDTVVNATINYTYKFPYDISAVTMLKCSNTNGYCRGDLPTQRFIVLDKNKELTANITATATVPSACEYQIVNNNPVYKVSGKIVSELEYLKAGCCDVNPNYLRNQDAILEYRNSCMENDVVYFENECGTKSELGKKVDTAADGTSFSTTTCTNNSYIDYTHSYIWQLPMNKIVDRLNQRESGAYTDNLTGIYDNEGISNYTDKSYVQGELKGKDGSTLSSMTPANNYCMLFTSEENNLYFPGTAIATSGRFFVFNELNDEECANSIEPGTNCFRQPYVTGQIYTMMHTNFTKWEKDYLAAIEEEKSAYNEWQNGGKDSDKLLYETAKLQRQTLEKYKTECEQRNNIENYWSYNLNPTLNFSYRQKVYGGTNRTETITETVPMEVSKEAVRYWPRVSENVSVIANSKSGSKNNKTYSINYGAVSESKTFDTTSNYSVGFEQTIYYKPQKVTYATLPTGQYIVAEEKYQTSPVYTIENGLRVGYVYNVRLTTYEGAYTTSFTIDKVGHLGLNGVSNVQKTLDKYKKDNDLTKLSSECVYCNQEGQFERVCEECPDPDNPELGAKYVYRTISLSDVTPNDRANSNWSDEKGSSAEERIQSLSGDKVVANLNTNGEDVKVSLLADVDEKSAKIETIANGDIYNDDTREYLEYEFNLSSKDMTMIKKNTQRADFSYAEFSLCGTSNSTPGKSETANYCFICNADGKECKSTFIDAYGEASTTAITRANKWKYYINNKWEFGSMSSISGFENGRYPDPTNQEAYLKINKNWP